VKSIFVDQMHDMLDLLPDLKWSFLFCYRCFVHHEAISIYSTSVKIRGRTHKSQKLFSTLILACIFHCSLISTHAFQHCPQKVRGHHVVVTSIAKR